MAWLAKCSWKSSIQSVNLRSISTYLFSASSCVGAGGRVGNATSSGAFSRQNTQYFAGVDDSMPMSASDICKLLNVSRQSVCAASRPKAVLVSYCIVILKQSSSSSGSGGGSSRSGSSRSGSSSGSSCMNVLQQHSIRHSCYQHHHNHNLLSSCTALTWT
jgi:hypothetical protein